MFVSLGNPQIARPTKICSIFHPLSHFALCYRNKSGSLLGFVWPWLRFYKSQHAQMEGHSYIGMLCFRKKRKSKVSVELNEAMLHIFFTLLKIGLFIKLPLFGLTIYKKANKLLRTV